MCSKFKIWWILSGFAFRFFAGAKGAERKKHLALCSSTQGQVMTIRRPRFSKTWPPSFCGETGIRTQGAVARTPHFECGPFDHSGISPGGIVNAKLRVFMEWAKLFCAIFPYSLSSPARERAMWERMESTSLGYSALRCISFVAAASTVQSLPLITPCCMR